jgi:hypothetical protein
MKVRAAANSMHQFLPVLRNVVPATADEAMVEAATVFLYERITQEVFGKRFASRMRTLVRDRYKFGTPIEVDSRVWKITRYFEEFEAAEKSGIHNDQEAFTVHVRAVIRAFLAESGLDPSNEGLVKEIFPRFEAAARTLKRHLSGIRQQSHFVMG